MVWLLDGNVLTALVIASHVHHERAKAWFYEQDRTFATCAITDIPPQHTFSVAIGSNTRMYTRSKVTSP